MNMADSKFREMNEILSYPENRLKNAVSLLLEAAAQVGESATFNFIDEIGLSNLKLFTCEVKVGRLIKCRGIGPNKKAAKANAADQALETVKNRADVSGTSPGPSQVSPSHSLQKASTAAGDSPNTTLNPIGSLQEMCVKSNWTPPNYELLRETGEAHTKTFIYECKIDSWVAQGQGKSKKSAKKIAADNMLSMVKLEETSANASSLNSSSRSPFRDFPDKLPRTPSVMSPQDRGPPPSHRSSSPVPFLSSQLYDDDDDDDEASYKHVVSHSFVDNAIKEEFCSMLEDKGSETDFSFEYHDLSQKGYSGNYLCFVRLDTNPPTVCSGMGCTKAFAHEKAAQNALQYLNTVSS